MTQEEMTANAASPHKQYGPQMLDFRPTFGGHYVIMFKISGERNSFAFSVSVSAHGISNALMVSMVLRI